MEERKSDLSEIFAKYGSDKLINGYLPLYHTIFNPLRDKSINLLEIGIGTMIPGAWSSMVGYAMPNYKPGGSLRAWRDYFSNGYIYGLDVQLDTQFLDERITTNICNSTDENAVKNLMEKLNIKFDIIIDDGSHSPVDQYKTIKNFYKYVKDGGLYIIEDIFPGSEVSTNPKKLVELCDNDPFFYVGFKNNICVVYKNHLQHNDRINF